MNIHSSYRKLNDYKGASCGQHSALSTQHSALSTQHSARSGFFTNVSFWALVCFSTLSNAQDASLVCTEDKVVYREVLSIRTDLANNPSALYYFNSSGRTYYSTLNDLCKPQGVPINADPNKHYHVRFLDTDAGGYIRCTYGFHTGAGLYVQYYHEEIGVGFCEKAPPKPTITLTPAPNQKDPRPKGTEGKDPKSSTYELIAKVMEGSTPKAGVAVTFGVEPIANSGGHDHHDASRPKGLVNGALTASGKTEANGEIKVTFQASEFSGTHVVAAVCDSCTNKSVTKNVDVKVPSLIELGDDLNMSARYTLVGDTPKHQSNHFFSPEAKDALFGLFPIFEKFGWGVVGVNDSSLKWGGRFDIAGHWNNGHAEHRDGKEVDISFYKPFYTINDDKRDKVYEYLKKTSEVGMPQVLWHEKDNPATPSYAHFHVYLLGQSYFRKKTY